MNPEKVWDYCSVPICMFKALDFSADNDQLPDSNGEFTGATLNAGALPESFTICSAASRLGSSQVAMFTMLDDEGINIWGRITLYAAPSSTQFILSVGRVRMFKESDALLFQRQWIQVCLSLDSIESKMTLVVDGQLLGEAEYRREKDDKRPANLKLRIGYDTLTGEYSVKIANLNVFNSPLSLERMVGLTMAGEEECGAPGNLVSWEEAEWTLHSQAKMIEVVDKGWEGPCRRESQVHFFPANFEYHHDCMQHCEKIGIGRSPPVNTEEEWNNLTEQIDLITPDQSKLPRAMWISATEGDQNQELARLDHWPKTEVVKNETKKLEAVETVWRDFYTGQRLDNWTKPLSRVYQESDSIYGDTFNCLAAYTKTMSWNEWQCGAYSYARAGCPCSYSAQPVLRLRGLCSPRLMDFLFTPTQFPDNPGNMILLGQHNTRIDYIDGQWHMNRNTRHPLKAVSNSTKESYLLGKHEWEISYDVFECSKGKPYRTTLKLTGCKEEDEFTCDDGQCIEMRRRCDQVTGKEPNCRDKSDEIGCHLILFEGDYNKNIPPIGSAEEGSANVYISITLMKVVEIEETDHSIHLQFQISIEWKEKRVKYRNLKKKTSLNALTEEDIETIWLPLIVYDNTDQKEVTRLGMVWEWGTSVTVTREEENPKRSKQEEIDETEYFQGDQNRLTMNQTYTLEFQCKYKLQRYPFDTQVFESQLILIFRFTSGV